MKPSPMLGLVYQSREVSGVERQSGVVRVVRGLMFTFPLQVCPSDLCE